MLNIFDYSVFDIILLYKLIRYFCFLLELLNIWGIKLIVNDVFIGDDIEWIREFRNKCFVYVECGKIFDDDFMEFWSDVKCIIKRC